MRIRRNSSSYGIYEIQHSSYDEIRWDESFIIGRMKKYRSSLGKWAMQDPTNGDDPLRDRKPSARSNSFPGMRWVRMNRSSLGEWALHRLQRERREHGENS